MLPKIEIRYSWIYNIKMDKKFRKEDLSKLKQDCLEFETIFNDKIKPILRNIERNSKKWHRRNIVVYPVRKTSSSFFDPLTILYDPDPNFMFVMLVHELIHVNLENYGFGDATTAHLHMEKVLNKVFLSFKDEFNKALLKFNSLVRRNYCI